MKLATRIKDLKASISCSAAKADAIKICAQVIAEIENRTIIIPDLIKRLEDLNSARAAAAAASNCFMAIPKGRRDHAQALQEEARTKAVFFAGRIGGTYSGETVTEVRWRDVGLNRAASAYTTTSVGDQYSRTCSERRTDATHTILLDPEGIPLLPDNPELANSSLRDGLPLIALYPGGLAVWVLRKNKSIVSQLGYIAYDKTRRMCFHHSESLAHAERGLAKKILAFERDQAALAAAAQQRAAVHKAYRFSPAGIAERRTKLVARFCSGVTASFSDALAMGYCEPGIRAFQQDFGLGDKVALPDLLRTGNPSAVRLALTIARKFTAPPASVHVGT